MRERRNGACAILGFVCAPTSRQLVVYSLSAIFFVSLFASVSHAQANNYGRESDVNINWRARGVSIARDWNEGLLYCIRRDLARPCIHARNLWHFSLVVYDAWAAYAPDYNKQYLFKERANTTGLTPTEVDLARNETISFAAYHLLLDRFKLSPGYSRCLSELNRKLSILGFNISEPNTTARTMGRRIAELTLSTYLNDGSNEIQNYNGTPFYQPSNPPLSIFFGGNEFVTNINRWQPLALGFFTDQSGVIQSSYPAFIGPHWGRVTPFALNASDLTPGKPFVYMDTGGPPQITLNSNLPLSPAGMLWKMNHTQVIEWASFLSPTEGRGRDLIDISPAGIGNNPLGTNSGRGYAVNPYTGRPYEHQYVPFGDYTRVLAEFWADGPFSETPPGHWNSILNYVSYHPSQKRRYRNLNESWAQFDRLEWDVKAYFTLNSALHDAAIVAWGLKGYYDSARPVAAIRYMAMRGQSSNSSLPNFSHHGLPLIPGLIEVITTESSAPGQRHANLSTHVGKIAVYSWLGHAAANNSAGGYAGVGWMLGERWLPFQAETFVTPPFAGYVSGHSTYSRTAARVMEYFTGDKYFPGGIHRFTVPNTTFLVFERGPSVNMELQWATYYDAADECSLSRIYGGIHPSMDDIPGRLLGHKIGEKAFSHACTFYEPPRAPELPTQVAPTAANVSAAAALAPLTLLWIISLLYI